MSKCKMCGNSYDLYEVAYDGRFKKYDYVCSFECHRRYNVNRNFLLKKIFESGGFDGKKKN